MRKVIRGEIQHYVEIKIWKKNRVEDTKNLEFQ